MKNILFIAPPAGGKGTISDNLVKDFNYVHISTGDLIREIDEKSEIGKMVQECMKTGKFVDDNIVLSLLKEKLLKLDIEQPFVIDGFPRSIIQAEELNDLLNKIDRKLDLVIYIDIDYDTCLKRAIGRISCPNCHATFNEFFKKPKEKDVCNECGAKLIKRIDDNEESFEKRYKTFEENTLPLVEYYEKKSMLVRVGKENTYEEVIRVIKND